MWCPAADTHHKLLNRVVSGVSYLTTDVLQSNITHRRSVAVLGILYKVKCNQMYILYGAQSVPYANEGYTLCWSHIGSASLLMNHRVDSFIESSLQEIIGYKNYALNDLG